MSSTTELTTEPFRHLFDDLAAGELERERTGRAPHVEVRLLARSGYGALRLDGASLVDLVEATIELATADANVAHLLRNHFLFVEAALLDPDAHRRWLDEVAEGLLFGMGFGESDMPLAGAEDFGTTLTPAADGDGFVLEGVKYYSTGNLYCDRICVKAATPRGVRTAVVPTDRAGVECHDDWDGFGQRFTASGTTTFTGVRVEADEVLPVPAGRPSPLAQVYLTAVLAGIAAACARDAVALVQGRTRNYFHGLHVEPRRDPVLQTTVGRLSADAYAARAIVLEAARSLGTERAPLDAARAKVVVDELVTRSTSGLLDAGSASAVRSGLALDRHWRNARTVIAHNPGSYKLRVLGDHALNGTPAPEGSFF